MTSLHTLVRWCGDSWVVCGIDSYFTAEAETEQAAMAAFVEATTKYCKAQVREHLAIRLPPVAPNPICKYFKKTKAQRVKREVVVTPGMPWQDIVFHVLAA